MSRGTSSRYARAVAQQQALAEISKLALQTTDGRILATRCAELIATALKVELVAVFELSADKRIFRTRGSFGWPSPSIEHKAIPAAACRPLYEALAAEDCIAFAVQDFVLFPRDANPSGEGVAIPMGDPDARAGVLTVCTRDASRRFEEGEISFLGTIAFIIAAVWERRRAEAVLLLRNQALEALDQGILITDASRLDNPLIYVNPAFEKLTGYSASEVLGKNPRFLQGPETDWKAVRELRKSTESGAPYRDTIVNYRKDGSQFWNDLTISTVRRADGTPTHYVGVLSDVSEHVRLEAQLRQAQKMEALGHLTGGIAHDFNNLLAVILGNAEILLDEISETSNRELIELVMETAERGAVLTQRLLAFGRRQSLRPQPMDLLQSVQSLQQMLQRSIGEQCRITLKGPSRPCIAMADRAMFESAILNLAVNSRDAMPGGGELDISVDEIEAPSRFAPAELAAGKYVRVQVRDTGTGMPPNVMARVFEPFFTTKENGRGSGLGLAMVYGFAKQSGGHVAIESWPSRGTLVSMFLPASDRSIEVADDAGDEDLPAPKGSERILLVEDETEVRRFVSRILVRLGYTVIVAGDARAAVDVLETATPVDLIFSDLILPGGTNGLQLVEKATALRPDLRVLLTTGYTEEYNKLAEAESAPVLRKPYRRDELASKLRQVLEGT